jgi:DNA-binding CsgD family transcriptional regulator
VFPPLAVPQEWLDAPSQSMRRPRRASLPHPRGRARGLLAAFDLALAALAAPALVLSTLGDILQANPRARTLRASELGSVRRLLAAVVASGPAGATMPSAGAGSWELTPLGGGGGMIGFLAILHAPPTGQALGEALRAASRQWKLTPRQGEVLELVARGLTNDLIADTLRIGKGTVEFHLGGIFDKAGVSNRSTLIVQAMELAGRR